MALEPRPPLARYRALVEDSARWDGFVFRPDDIVISTPAKCGTTWTQMICALLVLQTPDLPAPLDTLSPWLDMLTRPLDEVVADLDAQEHRRFIKTHTPSDGLPYDPRVTYLVVGRDPRDVFVSWDNHVDNTNIVSLLEVRGTVAGLDDLAELYPDGPPIPAATEEERFWDWVDNDLPVTGATSSLKSTVHLLAGWWELREQGADNVVFLHYDDLKADLAGQMRALADRLGIAVPDERWTELVQAASFEAMKAKASERAPGLTATSTFWNDSSRFFNKGTSGQWERVLRTDEDRARYAERIRQLASPEVLTWMHAGAPI